MSSNTFAVFVGAILCLAMSVQLSSCWTFRPASPLPARVLYAEGGSTTVEFRADVPLVACQCRTHLYIVIGPLMDFSQGVKSPSYNHHSGYGHYNASFSGPALEQKGCGVKLSDLTYYYTLLVCRARPAQGNWQYQQVALVHDGEAEFPMTVQPPQQVVLPGSSAVVVCKAGRPLRYCNMIVPRKSYRWLRFHSDNDSAAEAGVKYAGRSLVDGDCGAEVSNTTDADSGPVWCWGRSVAGTLQSHMYSLLLVAAPPSKVLLTFPSGTNVKAGNRLTATCTVSPSRPVANITWLLGTDVIREDLTDDVIVPDPAWVWPWDTQSITQTLFHVVSTQDHGKELTCRVNHLAPKSTLIQKQKISVLSDCGKKGPTSQALVAGGSTALVGEFPWHVGLYIKDDNSYSFEHQCDGTLVTPRMVITAAQCIIDPRFTSPIHHSKFRVALGRIGLNWNITETGEIKMGIQEIKLNKRYNRANFNNDIAIVILEHSVPLSTTIALACVEWESSEHEQLMGQNGTVAGWGLTSSGTHNSEFLNSVQLPWVSEKTCWDAIPENTQQFYTADKFCAGLVNKNTSVCGGDSGGGLLFAHPTTKLYYLRGIVSTSFAPDTHHRSVDGCYSQQYTGFTRLSFHMRWIKDNRVT